MAKKFVTVDPVTNVISPSVAAALESDFAPPGHLHDDRYIRTVNGIGPDGVGNVVVAGGDGGAALSGSGSPVGTVTPSSVGALYVDTAATLGARMWISTGTANTAWRVVLGDTGARKLTEPPGWAGTAGSAGVYLRRTGSRVRLSVSDGKFSATAADVTIAGRAAGFEPTVIDSAAIIAEASENKVARLFCIPSSIVPTTMVRMSVEINAIYNGYVEWDTAESWPTVLPGTASA